MPEPDEPREPGAWSKLLAGIDEKIGRVAKLVRTRPAASEYYYSIARQVLFNDVKRPDIPQLVWRNKTEGVALRRIVVIFDTPPDNDYHPAIQITLGKRTIVAAAPDAEAPYQNADLSIDLMNGLKIGVEEALEFSLWAKKGGAVERSASVFIDLGEA